MERHDHRVIERPHSSLKAGRALGVWLPTLLLLCACGTAKPKGEKPVFELPITDAKSANKIEVFHVPAADPGEIVRDEPKDPALALLEGDDEPVEGEEASTDGQTEAPDGKPAAKQEASDPAKSDGDGKGAKHDSGKGQEGDKTAPSTHATTDKESKPEPASKTAAKGASKDKASSKTDAAASKDKPESESARKASKAPGADKVVAAEGAKTPKKPKKVVRVTMPGFRAFSDGSSRVYVQISGRTKVTEKREERVLRYRMLGVAVPERVNRMPLPTVHFQTPVLKAFIAQIEGGAELVIVLRQPAAGKVRLRRSASSVILSVDFEKMRKVEEEAKDPLVDAG